jgi:hypothetical protein
MIFSFKLRNNQLRLILIKNTEGSPFSDAILITQYTIQLINNFSSIHF